MTATQPDNGTTINAPATRAGLTAAIAIAPKHLRPVLIAVRDYRAGLLMLPQDPTPFEIPGTRPAIMLICDDTDRSEGPAGFHRGSLRRAIRACEAFAVVSAAPMVEAYAGAAAMAIAGRSAMIVETRLEHEFQWVALIEKLAPGRPLLIVTVKGGHA